MKRNAPFILIGTTLMISGMILLDLDGKPEPATNAPEEMTSEELTARIRADKMERRAERRERGLPYGPGTEPNDWSFRQRAYPYDRINHDELTAALGGAQAMRAAARAKSGARVSWTERGPSNIGARVTDLIVHPTDPNLVYAAMASGGLFKSTDGGTNWTPIFDDQPVLTIGDIAFDPQDPDVIYVGTGEANAHSFSWFGVGVFRSDDGGATWNHVGLEETKYIGRIVIDPNDQDRIWVAATGVLFGTGGDRGIYRTTNGCGTWEQVLFVNDSTAAIDVAIHPDCPDTLFAAMWERVRGLNYRRSAGDGSGIYRSYDGGDTWTEMTSGLPTGSDVGRIGLSIAASNPDIVYAIYDMPGSSCRVYKTTNGGDSWTRTNDGALAGIHSSFGWYFGNIRVDPSNPNRAFALGVPFYRTENGGTSWSEVGWDNHVDHHALAFAPSNPSLIYEGNDGGIYRSDNQGDSWTKLYNQPTNQFYAIEIDYLNPQRLYGGTQDNGTLRTPTGATDDWENILGGDGFYTLVDPTNSNTIFAEYQWGNLYKSTNFGYSWSWALNGVSSGDRRNWSSPVVFDPADPQRMYFGTYRLWRTTNGAGSWSAISGDLTNGDQGGGYGTITTIAASPADTDVIWVGTDDSNVWVSQNGGGSWSNVSAFLPNRWVTRVAADPIDPATAYVTFSGLRWDQEISHVYRTDNYGFSWTDISGNLPEAPVHVILVDPDTPATLYIGCDVGCFISTNTGGSWSVLGDGLPSVPIDDLKFHGPTRTLAAGTHGRSIYSIDMTVSTIVAGDPVPASPDGAHLENSPNPFNPVTTITYGLERAGRVDLGVYDLSGRRVRSLVSGEAGGGDHQVAWDGTDESGRAVSSGTYFLRLQAEGVLKTKKINLIR